MNAESKYAVPGYSDTQVALICNTHTFWRGPERSTVFTPLTAGTEITSESILVAYVPFFLSPYEVASA